MTLNFIQLSTTWTIHFKVYSNQDEDELLIL
jgi:hypothetical protein